MKLTEAKSVVQLRRMAKERRGLSSSTTEVRVLDLNILSKSSPSIRCFTITSWRSRRMGPLTPQRAKEEHHLEVSCGDMDRTSMVDKMDGF